MSSYMINRGIFIDSGNKLGIDLSSFRTPKSYSEMDLILKNSIFKGIDNNDKMLENYLHSYYTRIKQGLVHPNYDCSEITEDFLNISRASNLDGCRLSITSYNGFFYISCRGNITMYEYHDVFLYNGRIYDPEFSKYPTILQDYIINLYKLNNNLEVILTVTED